MIALFFYIAFLALLLQSAYLAFISFWPVNTDFGRDNSSPVTILVCAKNEEDHIDFLIRTLMRQQYPNFNVLIVDDQSTDGTVGRVRTWQEKYPDQIQLFSVLQKQYTGKKGAIWEALPHIQSEYILFIDADCRPMSRKWINLMIANFENGKYDVVLGYSPIHKKKGVTNLLQRMQNTWTAWQYIGFAYRGKAYMSVGRNWAVKTTYYKKHQNIEQHGHIPSGDDDLVLQSLSTNGKVNVQRQSEAWVMTWASTNFKDWWDRRLRHINAGFMYTASSKLLLLVFPVSVLTTMCLVLYYLIIDPFVGVAILAAQFAVWIIFSRSVLRKLGQHDLLAKLPVLLPIELAFQAIAFLLTLFGKKSKWR